MSQKTGIEWTDATWNPVRGCSRVSEGCRNCYAERVATRFAGDGQPFAGFAGVLADVGGFGRPIKRMVIPRWTGRVELIPEKLDEPLRWKKPRRIFVNSMSDLFHERLSVEAIAKVFSVMGAAWWHTYQILTKRAERMAAVLPEVSAIMQREGRAPLGPIWRQVWLGVSVEDQTTADERIPLLLQTPAALRFVSYEPALGPVDFRRAFGSEGPRQTYVEQLDWIIVGGESGPGARPFDVAWARSAVAQCKAARVPVFVKQLGARPYAIGTHTRDGLRQLRDRKGGDPSEWPEDLRIREFPEVK